MNNNNNNQPLRYFLYARKSSESEDRQVASIESQVTELQKLAATYGVNIVRVFTESKSAKEPNNRKIFTEMVERIYKGEAQGILCWKLDRLARNPVDGGTINWMLQGNVIKHIRTFDREYFPTDNVLMMSVEFGMANQFIRDLSSNTKRGLMSKVQKGVFPSKPPIGYLNDKYKPKGEKGIMIDPERFHIVRKLWDHLLTGKYTVDAIHTLAAEKYKLIGLEGSLMPRSVLYRIFTNPFYFGNFTYAGKVWPGTHQPMISKEEFDTAQDILSGRNKVHSKKKHHFPFTGMIRCGECGGCITAEHKLKRQKNGNEHEYKYYHCTRRKGVGCSQESISDKELERQVLKILETIEIPTVFREWALEVIKADEAKDRVRDVLMLNKFRKDYDKCLSQINILKDMRLNGEIDSDEFNEKKEQILTNKQKIQELINDLDVSVDEKIERINKKLTFAEKAKERFEIGGYEDKKIILSSLGSDFILKDKTLSFNLEAIFQAVRTCAEEDKKLRMAFEPLKNGYGHEEYTKMYSSSPEMGA